MKCSEPDWKPTTPSQPPAPDGVDVWRVELHADSDRVDACRRVLASDELDRASRFRGADLQRRFIVRRWARRRILCSALGVPPESLRFDVGAHGKPTLAPRPGGAAVYDLQFNCSASGDLALIAIARQGPIGVDLERIEPANADRSTAERFMSPGELMKFQAAATADRLSQFFSCWARKESILKADGRGLALDPRQIDLSGSDDRDFVRFPGVAIWGLCVSDLKMAPPVRAALAFPRGVRTCRFFQLC